MRILPLFIIIPLAAAFVLSLFDFIKDEDKKYKITDIFSVITGLGLLAMAILVFGKTGVYHMGHWKIPQGISLVIDGFSGPVLLISNFVAFMCILFSLE